jgi:threonine synthase
MAQRMGLPCAGFIAAVNANRVVPDFLASGLFSPRPSLPTIAHAMDVGNPSNLERIRDLFGDDLGALRAALTSSSHTDDEIRDAIGDVYRRTGTILDPHTAVGYLALARHRRETSSEQPAVLLATAHPAKFPETVEPVIGAEVPLPPQLAACLERPFERRIIAPDGAALEKLLLAPWPDGF